MSDPHTTPRRATDKEKEVIKEIMFQLYVKPEYETEDRWMFAAQRLRRYKNGK